MPIAQIVDVPPGFIGDPLIDIYRPGAPETEWRARMSVSDAALALPHLVNARVTLDSPHSWTQGVAAMDCLGNSIVPSSNAARKFCLYGATDRNCIGFEYQGVRNAIAVICQAVAPVMKKRFNLAEWNDAPERTHAEILTLLDNAIAVAAIAHCFQETARATDEAIVARSRMPIVAGF